MEIKIDDKALTEYVEKAVNEKIESLTDEIIKDKVFDALLEKVDGILTVYKGDIKYFVEKHVEDYIKSICPTIDKKVLEDVGKSIAHSLAYELRDVVLASIAYRLMPDSEDDGDEDEE